MKTFNVKTVLEVVVEVPVEAETEEAALKALEEMGPQDIMDETSCLGDYDLKSPTFEVTEEDAHYDIFVHDIEWDAADVDEDAHAEVPIKLSTIKAYTLTKLDVYNARGEISDVDIEDAIEEELEYQLDYRPLTYKYTIIQKY